MYTRPSPASRVTHRNEVVRISGVQRDSVANYVHCSTQSKRVIVHELSSTFRNICLPGLLLDANSGLSEVTTIVIQGTHQYVVYHSFVFRVSHGGVTTS